MAADNRRPQGLICAFLCLNFLVAVQVELAVDNSPCVRVVIGGFSNRHGMGAVATVPQGVPFKIGLKAVPESD
jgi:hypothetical protein